MRQLLARRDTRIYLTGQMFSLFGDSTLWLAMGIWVKTLTGSNARAGLVFFFFTAPSLVAPLLGLLADRVRCRPLLVATNAGTAVSVLALLTVSGPGQVWVIDAVMLAYGLSYSLLGPAQSALLTVLVPADLLPEANGALRTAQELFRLIGPLAGAGLFVAVGPHVIAIIDAASFAFPVVSLLLLRVSEPAARPTADRLATQLTAGARHIWHTVELRQTITAGACTTTVFGLAETVTYAIASDGLHRPAAFVGVLAALQGGGALLGGLSSAALVRRLGEGRMIGMAMVIASVGAMLEIPPLLPVVLAGGIVLGTTIPWLVVGLITLAQRLTPTELQGRVYSTTETLLSTPQTVSIALGAALITAAGYQTLLLVMASGIALAASYLLTRPEQRQPARQLGLAPCLLAIVNHNPRLNPCQQRISWCVRLLTGGDRRMPGLQFIYCLYARHLRKQVSRGRLPRHVGIIMDGNRRWARQQAMSNPSLGHKYGAEHIATVLGWCEKTGIKHVTVFMCSTENLLSRNSTEVAFLMDAIEGFTVSMLSRDLTWQVHIAGDLDMLPDTTARALKRTSEATRDCDTGAHLTLAVGYGGRQEVIDAIRSLLHEHDEKGTSLADLAEAITTEDITRHLYTAGQPDPDLVIRTSGEQRLSNFLLWQSAYSELYFCEAYWPAFREIDFLRALRSFAERERRYGR